MDKWDFLKEVLTRRRYIIKYGNVYRKNGKVLKKRTSYRLCWHGETHLYTIRQLKEFNIYREQILVGWTQAQIDDIKILIDQGMKHKDIALLYDTHDSVISNIKHGKVKAHKTPKE